MTRYIVCLIVIAFAFSNIACSGSKAPAKTDLTPSQEDALSNASSDSKSETLSDFADSIYMDIEEIFKESSMTLASLQKNKKGTLIKASIEESNAKLYVPKAITLLHDNFKRLDEIIIIAAE